MKKLIIVFAIGTSIIVSACGNSVNEDQNKVATLDTISNVADTPVDPKTYDVKILDNKKDPTCGMPVSAGVSDTAHYQNKVIGFCSTECKAEFLKNPKANIAAAELNK